MIRTDRNRNAMIHAHHTRKDMICTLNEYYNRPLFKLNFFCLKAIISKCIKSEIMCMVMDFSLAIF